ncbi:MAG: MTH1187 family thiamine-binding protein [Dehalococcoidia bacterium]|nr:MTH1187 family thiamine-binding protein [Dehalococcoidia bacterium]MDZ4245696.1 MTH1187 family thiamine-binding protein [Dehalococcoidia bacterium]
MAEHQVVAEVSVVPLGTGNTSLSEYVSGCLQILKKSPSIKYELTAMGTIIEGPLDLVLDAVKEMHQVPFDKGAQRVVTTLKIDDRRDKAISISSKVKSVIEKM